MRLTRRAGRERDGGGAERWLRRRERARRAGRAEQAHDEVVADRAADGEPADDPGSDPGARRARARAAGDGAGRGERAGQHAQRDKHDDAGRTHADLAREPWVGDDVGRDPDQQRRPDRAQRSRDGGPCARMEARGHVTSRRIDSSVAAAAKASPLRQTETTRPRGSLPLRRKAGAEHAVGRASAGRPLQAPRISVPKRPPLASSGSVRVSPAAGRSVRRTGRGARAGRVGVRQPRHR